MRFGFHFFDMTLPGGPAGLAPAIRAAARTSDDIGASWFTVMDHFFQMEQFRTAHDPMLEGYTTLGFAAGVTERVKLGTIVTGVTYRHPGLLSKIVTTLDVLSEGRAFLGLGAAWYEREHLALGVPFPPLKERFERLEETLQIAHQMWSDNEGPFEGKHYQLAETISVPKPVQSPRPPIVIGGSGEQKTLRLVAQYADATNLIAADAETITHKLAVLQGHCDAVGRDYETIERTAQTRLAPDFTADEVLAQAEAFAGAGIQHLHFGVIGPDPAASIARFGDEVAPRLSTI
ncbi:F420-dependent oxidoreductase-like protein [Microbacteriaceae bacterium SG_E_30_P1]|uniref:F420-dependent oxidoreductase-like protein n=1 Tax=Antiquaquibacter oligotrophicus TaxID=2880260 RepID=A0ABT6KTK2_9MICO|nr:LLM class F420-dependent oxidoreductase [Antiquaquibacter oligotrophicus]MDH6182529.1 F420-dependent oxidoreductase-like protein [Antiquaquibacter oligotrophicus]UDF14502.1 LLM class F420-dependent oxidoreductase [Antiquaquibacter oligotrophicus]